MAESMELGEITLEKFRLWTPEALKYYLSIRKRSVTGSFDELVARLVKKNCLWTCHCVSCMQDAKRTFSLHDCYQTYAVFMSCHYFVHEMHKNSKIIDPPYTHTFHF